MAKRLKITLISGLIFIAGCESPEDNPLSDTYFPADLGYEWEYWVDPCYDDGSYPGWESWRYVTFVVDSVHSVSGYVYYGTTPYEDHNDWPASWYFFPDIGRTWGIKEDSIIGYGENGRIAYTLTPQEGDSLSTSMGEIGIVSYNEDTLCLSNRYISWVDSSNTDTVTAFRSWYLERIKGIGMIFFVDSFYQINHSTGLMDNIHVEVWILNTFCDEYI